MRTIAERGPELMWKIADKLWERSQDRPPDLKDDVTSVLIWRSPVTYSEDERYYVLAYCMVTGDEALRDSTYRKAWEVLPRWEGTWEDGDEPDQESTPTHGLDTARACALMSFFLAQLRTSLESTETTCAFPIDDFSGAAFDSSEAKNQEGERFFWFYYALATTDEAKWEEASEITDQLPGP